MRNRTYPIFVLLPLIAGFPSGPTRELCTLKILPSSK